MRGNKIDALNSSWVSKLLAFFAMKKAPVCLVASGAFLWTNAGCVMTKAQGDRLTEKVLYLEDEVAKLQRVRHDMELLVVGQIRSLIDRIASIEGQIGTFKETMREGSSKNSELLSELMSLRGELEVAQNRYKSLEADQQSLLKNQMALKEAQAKIRVPPLKNDHFALAKKYYAAEKYEEAIFLFEQFIKEYQSDSDLTYQSQYYLGESCFSLASKKESLEDKDRFHKKSVVAFQKVVLEDNDNLMRVEALFKLGLALTALKNPEGAIVAFKELLFKHNKSKRIKDAKAKLAELEKK